MTDIYHSYKTDAVKRYLFGDDYSLKINRINYTIGDRDLVPKLFDYCDFNHSGKYYFLLHLLPKEIWYIIFEMKFAIEKMEYVTLYFTPEYKTPELLHTSGETKDGRNKYFKPNTVWGRMYNDFVDVKNTVSRSNTKIQRALNMMTSLKEFINRWYFYVKEMRNNYYDDLKLFKANVPIEQLFYKGNYEKISRYLSLYNTINSKIFNFEEVIFNLVDVPEERNKKVIAKILMYDIKSYAFKFLYNYNGILDEHIEQGWRSDFLHYYEEFGSWVKKCGIETQDDIVGFLEELGNDYEWYYYNPMWFEKDEDSDDFPLWVMIQELC